MNIKLEKRIEEEKVDSTLFKQIVGSLRLDIYFAMGLISRFMDDLRRSRMNLAIREDRCIARSL